MHRKIRIVCTQVLIGMLGAGAMACGGDPASSLGISEPPSSPSTSGIASSASISDGSTAAAEETAIGAEKSAAAAISASQATSVRSARRIPEDSLRTWSMALDKVAARSRRGEASVALRRQLLHALSAPTDELLHSRFAQLPVTIWDSAGYEQGVAGNYRNYSVRGKTRVSVFYRNNAHGEDFTKNSLTGWLEEENQPVDRGSGSGDAHSPADVPTVTFCEVDTPETGYMSGDCATQQELDEAASALSLIDADVAAQTVEFDAAVACSAANNPTWSL